MRTQFLELGIALVFGGGSFSGQKNERTRAKRNDHKWNPTKEGKVKKGMDEKRRSRVGSSRNRTEERHCETGRLVIDLSEGSIAVGGKDG